MKFLLSIILFSISLSSFADDDGELLLERAKKKGMLLTDRDKIVLDVGHISDTRYIVGGIIGTYPIGFGLGHAVQGRWGEKGWIFTTGEGISLAVTITAAMGCATEMISSGKQCHGSSSTFLALGLVSFIGFRIWEVVDVWYGPPQINKHYKRLKKEIEEPGIMKKTTRQSLDLAPIVTQAGTGFGLRYNF